MLEPVVDYEFGAGFIASSFVKNVLASS
jgi:hypothetical protein